MWEKKGAGGRRQHEKTFSEIPSASTLPSLTAFSTQQHPKSGFLCEAAMRAFELTPGATAHKGEKGG